MKKLNRQNIEDITYLNEINFYDWTFSLNDEVELLLVWFIEPLKWKINSIFEKTIKWYRKKIYYIEVAWEEIEILTIISAKNFSNWNNLNEEINLIKWGFHDNIDWILSNEESPDWLITWSEAQIDEFNHDKDWFLNTKESSDWLTTWSEAQMDEFNQKIRSF
jgi:hypothetical protein